MDMSHWCNNNSDNPLESLFKKQHLSDQNPISPSPFLSNFPSPFFDENQLPLNQILPDHHNMDQTAQNNSDSTHKTETPKCSNNINHGPRKKMRSGKKDRHSKICTAQGIRDRRMRLSLQVARKFFDLQDMLGYDKASNTIEWLFSKSKKAINELVAKLDSNTITTDAKSESLVSECEVVSGIEENFSNNEIKEVNYVSSPIGVRSCETKKSRKTTCKPNRRELREKARARARCRTREKMMIKGADNLSQWCKLSPIDNDDVEKLASSLNNSPFECGVEYPDVGTIEKLLGIDHNSNFMGFLGNWDLLMNNNNDRLYNAVTNDQELLPSGNNPSYYSAAAIEDFPLFHH